MSWAYPQALEWLYRFADLERGAGVRTHAPFEHGIARVRGLLRALGDPHQAGTPYVHVAGSKGKGSVCVLVATAAEAAGLRTGLYTQPHLHTFRERLRIDGEIISPDDFAELAARVRPAVEAHQAERSGLGSLTTFEIATVMALLWFAERKVDLAVIEVGLGGRLDATNVITPHVTAVTRITLEHTRLLGDSLESIAREKAAIAKRGVPMVVARQDREVLDVVASCAEAAGAPLVLADALAIRGEPIWRFGRPMMTASAPHTHEPFTIGLIGRHQLSNAGVAWQVVRSLAGAGIAIPRDAVRTGFAAARWPGRLELVEPDPMVVVDGAHTPLAVAQIVASMRELLGRRRGPVIFGAYRDKLVPEMIGELGAFATDLIMLAPDHPRGWAPERLLRRYPEVGPARIARDAFEALAMARAACEPGQAVLATGSLSIAADVRAAAGIPCDTDPAVALVH